MPLTNVTTKKPDNNSVARHTLNTNMDTKHSVEHKTTHQVTQQLTISPSTNTNHTNHSNVDTKHAAEIASQINQNLKGPSFYDYILIAKSHKHFNLKSLNFNTNFNSSTTSSSSSSSKINDSDNSINNLFQSNINNLKLNTHDINATDESGKTILHMAVLENNVEKVLWLLSKGANINARTKRYETPLFLAVEKNIVEMVHLFLRKGASLKNGPFHKPCIVVAMENESKPIIGLLLAYGENINTIFESYDPTPESTIAKQGFYSKKKIEKAKEQCKKQSSFMKKLKLISKQFNYLNKIKNELPNKMVEELELLLENSILKNDAAPILNLEAFIASYKKYSVPKDSINKIGFLQSLAYFGYTGLLNELIKYGADIQKINDKGQRPLYYAIKRKRKNIITLLKLHEAENNKNRNTLLKELVFQHLIKTDTFNFSVNYCNKSRLGILDSITYIKDNNTILSRDLKLTSENLWKIKEQLAFKGYHLSDKQRKEDFTLFNEKEILDNYEKTAFTSIYSAAHTNQSIDKILTKYYISINHKSTQGHTNLHLAAHKKDIPTLINLLNAGADIGSVSLNSKNTPLQIACYYGNCEIVKILLDHPSMTHKIINYKSALDYSALHLAAKYGHIECVEHIIKHKADIDLQSIHGTPLDLALKYNKMNIAKKLIRTGANIALVKSNHPYITHLKSTREKIINELKYDNELVKNCILEMHRYGFDIQFYELVTSTSNISPKESSILSNDPNNLPILSIKIERIPAPDYRIFVTIVQINSTLQRKIVYTNVFSSNEYDNSLKITLPGFIQSTIQINNVGDILLQNVLTQSDISIGTFRHCIFDNVNTSKDVYCHSLKFINKSHFYAKNLAVQRLAGNRFDETFRNYGNMVINQNFYTLNATGTMNNCHGTIKARYSNIQYHLLLNDYGSIQTKRLNKLSGIGYSKIRNMQGIISSNVDNVVIENSFDRHDSPFSKKNIAYFGEIHNKHGGKIYSNSGEVIIKSNKLYCDDISFICGQQKTILNIKDKNSHTKAKLYFESPLSGNSLDITMNQKPILHSIAMIKNINLDFSNYNSHNGFYNNQIPILSTFGVCNIKVPAFINYSTIYTRLGGTITTTANHNPYSIYNYGKWISGTGAWAFTGKGFYHAGKSLLSIRSSLVFTVEYCSIQKPLFAGADIWLQTHFLEYNKDVFRSLGALNLSIYKPFNFIKELSNFGAIIIYLLDNEKNFFIKANIITNSVPSHYKKLNEKVNIDRTTQGDITIMAYGKHVQVGIVGQIFPEIEASGKAEINCYSFNLWNGVFGGNKGSFVKTLLDAHFGRAVTAGEMPCGFGSGGNAVIESAYSSIYLNHVELSCNKNIEFSAPIAVHNTSSNLYIGGHAHFKTPLNNHTLITNTTNSGVNVDMGQPFLYCFRAYKTMGISSRVVSPSPLVIIKGAMYATGVTNVIAAKMYVGGFYGSAPVLHSITPVDQWVEHYFCGHKKEYKCKWYHYDKQTNYPTVPAIFSAASSLNMKAYTGKSHGIFSATIIYLNVSGQYMFGLFDNNINFTHQSNNFQSIFPLFDECQRTPLHVIAAMSYATVYRTRFSSDYMGPLGPIVICTGNGQLKLNTSQLRVIPSLQQEAQNIVNVFMTQTGCGFLNARYTMPEEMVARLRMNSEIIFNDYAKTGKLLIDDVHLPLIVYVEVQFQHPNGKLENSLKPYLYLPKSFNDPRIKDGAGGMFALEDIIIQGDTPDASFRTTAHLKAGNKITFQNLNSVSHETRTFDENVTVEDTAVKKTLGKKSKRTTTRNIIKQKPQSGNTVTANTIQYENIANLHFKNATLNAGNGGITGKNIGAIKETGIAEASIEEVHGKARNAITSLEGTHHVVTHTIHPTTMKSEGEINFQSDTQHWQTLQAKAKGPIELNGNDILFDPMIVKDDVMPEYGRTKGVCHVTTGTQENAIPISLISEGSSISVKANNTVKGYAPQMAAAENVVVDGENGVSLDVLKLKTHLETHSCGFKGLSHIKQVQKENHERAIKTQIYSGNSILINSNKGDVRLVSPIFFAFAKLKITAENGNVTFDEAIFEHDIKSEQLSQSLEFFGSEAVQVAMQRNYKEAARKIAEEFPLFKYMDVFINTCKSKNKDVASVMTDGLKTLYSAYKTYESLSHAKNLKEFINSQISKEVSIRFGKDKCSRSWTEVALPWLSAREIIIKAKEIIAVGLQAEYQNLLMMADNIHFRPAQEKSASQQHSAGVTVGINVESGNLSMGVDGSKGSSEGTRNIYSHLRGTNTILIANNKISLKGICIETLNAMLEAEELEIETVQDTQKSKHQHGSISTGGSFSVGSSSSDEKWSAEQAGINARGTLLIRIKKQLSLIGAKLDVGNSGTILNAIDTANNPLSFYEYIMPQDTGDDFFYCLNITRAETAKKLLNASNNPEYRVLLAPEIENALFNEGERTLPQEMQTHEITLLKKKLIDAQFYLKKMTAHYNNQLKDIFLRNIHYYDVKTEMDKTFVDYNIDDLPSKLPLRDKLILNEAIEAVENAYKAIHLYVSSPSTIAAFVRYYIAKPGNPIGYLATIGNHYSSSSMDAIAKINNLNLRVWSRATNGAPLKLVHEFVCNPSLPTIDLHHTHNETHFNLLSSKPGQIIAPIIVSKDVKDTKSQKEFSLSASIPSASIDSLMREAKERCEKNMSSSNGQPSSNSSNNGNSNSQNANTNTSSNKYHPESSTNSVNNASSSNKASTFMTAEFHNKSRKEDRTNYAYCSDNIKVESANGVPYTAVSYTEASHTAVANNMVTTNLVANLHRSGPTQSNTTVEKSHIGTFIVAPDSVSLLKQSLEHNANQARKILNQDMFNKNISEDSKDKNTLGNPVNVKDENGLNKNTVSNNKKLAPKNNPDTKLKKPGYKAQSKNRSKIKNTLSQNNTTNSTIQSNETNNTENVPINVPSINAPATSHSDSKPSLLKSIFGICGKYGLKILSKTGKKLAELKDKYPDESTLIGTFINSCSALENLAISEVSKIIGNNSQFEENSKKLNNHTEEVLKDFQSFCTSKYDEYGLNREERVGVNLFFGTIGTVIGGKTFKVTGQSKKTRSNLKTFLKDPDIQHCHLRDPELWKETKHLKYEAAPYHGKKDNAIKSKRPENGQDGLYNSARVKPEAPRRIGYDYNTGEFIIYDKTGNGTYHGHVNTWEKLKPEQREAAMKYFGFSPKGKLKLK